MLWFDFLEMIAAAPPETNPFGPAVPPSEAPSAITQAVASLPPEQMFELMKQMKVCWYLVFSKYFYEGIWY